jgi:putative glutamine amidotransferase
MMKIGVTACFFYPDKNRAVFSAKSLTYVENDMMNWLTTNRSIPYVIADLEDAALEKVISEMDGLILHGGADLAPQTYGEEPIHNGQWPGDIYRDNYELKVLKLALDAQLPVLGICRGHQLINVYFGGTLYQDINTQVKDSLVHRSAEIYDQLNHGVCLREGSWLEQLYKEDNIQVNSVHHQAVKKLASGLVEDAFCTNDHINEAFHYEGQQSHKIWGVQWHPEFSHSLGKTLDSPKPILEFFLDQKQGIGS